MKRILSILIIIALSTILALGYNASTNLALRLLEATDDVRPFREDFNYNFELVDDIFDDVTLTEYSYLDGVTSAIQTQLNSKQPLDTQLTDIAGLTPTNSYFIVGDGVNFVTETGATARDSLGLTIGTNIQAYDVALTSISGLTYVSPSFIKLISNDTYAVRTIAQTKTDLSLNLVENTALSTWTGTENITTLGTISTGTWEGTAIADGYVPNNITIDLATLATTFTCTDNESEALDCLLVFVDGASGAQGAETDGDLHYNPSTGTLTATEFVGGGTGLTGVEMALTDEASLYSTLSDVSLFLEDTVDDTSPELGGEMDAGAHSIGFTLQTATGDGATLINWTLGNKMKFTFGAQNETITFTDPSNPCNLLWIIVQDGTGSRTITYSGMTIKWAGGTAPTLTTAANGEDIVSMFWDGTSYYGVASLAFATP